jgi:excisionase family DNA binding protein
VNFSESQLASGETGALKNRLAFSLAESAKQLGVSVGFLRLEIGRKRLRPTRLGRRVLIRNQELMRYLAAQDAR